MASRTSCIPGEVWELSSCWESSEFLWGTKKTSEVLLVLLFLTIHSKHVMFKSVSGWAATGRILIYLSLICHLFWLVCSGNSCSSNACDDRHVKLCFRGALEILFGSRELYKPLAGNCCMWYPIDSVHHWWIPAPLKARASQVQAEVFYSVVRVPLEIRKVLQASTGHELFL